MDMHDRVVGELEDLINAETGISIHSLSVTPTLGRLLLGGRTSGVDVCVTPAALCHTVDPGLPLVLATGAARGGDCS